VDWQGKSRLALIDHGSMAVSDGRAATHWPERGDVLGRVAWMVPGRDGGTGASIELRNNYEQAFGDHPWLFVQ
jgi:hypothetical protein